MRNFWQRVWQTFIDFIFGASAINQVDWDILPCSSNYQTEIISVFVYRHLTMRQLIWRFKYKGDREITRRFADYLLDLILEEEFDRTEFDTTSSILIPIPARSSRLKNIGFNQCDRLVKEIAQKSPNNFIVATNILQKTKDTLSQSHTKSAERRRQNILGSFAVNIELQHQIKNKHIILIDDVWTTGATLNEAKKVLLAAGAKTVQAYTIAH